MFSFFGKWIRRARGAKSDAIPKSHPCGDHAERPSTVDEAPRLAHPAAPAPAKGGGNGHLGNKRLDQVVQLMTDRLGAQLGPQMTRDNRNLIDQMAVRSLEHQSSIERQIATESTAIKEALTLELAKQGSGLQGTFQRSINQMISEIAGAIIENTTEDLATLGKELRDASADNAKRAALLPVVDGLIALFDRIRSERSFLNTWYLKDPTCDLNLDCRELHGRYDSAVKSFPTEILMILRQLGVEQIQGVAGPFDPQHQRVVNVECTRNAELNGHIAKIVRAGFVWNGTVLRPEEVIVFKKERQSHGKET